MPFSKLSPKELNKRRVHAVKLRLQQASLDKIKSITGLSHPTIISAHKAFIKGGWLAVNIKERGRPVSKHHTDNAFYKCRLFMLNDNVAKQELWSINKIQAWLLENKNVNTTNKTISRYIKDWGISLNFDQQAKTNSSIKSNADKVYFADTITFTNLAEDDSKAYALCAKDLRGQIHWLCYKGYLSEQVILTFLQLLVSLQINKKTTVLLNSYSLTNYENINSWLNENKHIELNTINHHRQINLSHTVQQNTLLLKPSYLRNTMALTHLERLEAESIQIMREVVSKTENPVMLYSIGKDSAVMLHLAMKAFYPSKPPFSFMHVDTGWKFSEMYSFRDQMVKDLGIDLITYKNPAGEEQNINPFTHGSALHTDIMKTQGLKQALDKYKFDAAFGGARRDEEKSRAKERIFSFRTADHRWDPKNQRPELWKNYNANKKPGESIRVFPISNWTELDIWQYIYLEKIPVVPLYLSASRPVVERDGTLIMVDDERMPMQSGEVPMMRNVRFRTLGCYPLTGAVESEATTLPEIIQEMLLTQTSERQGRMIDKDSFASMEKKKQEGYF